MDPATIQQLLDRLFIDGSITLRLTLALDEPPTPPDEPVPGSDTVAGIIAATAAHFQTSPARLLARDRTPHIATARQVAMYLARQITSESLPAIGRAFDRNHTTVLHGVRAVEEAIAADPAARAAVEVLTVRLANGTAPV